SRGLRHRSTGCRRRHLRRYLLYSRHMSAAAADSEAIVRVEGLIAGYDGNVLLQDVNFAVNRGEVFVILGASGCGKSTLLKHMIGLYQPMAGKVLIDEIGRASCRERE